MKFKIKNNIEKITIALTFLSIGSFILLGNSLTFNFGQRLPVKLSEFILLFCVSVICILNIKNDKSIIRMSKFTKFVITMLIIGTISLLINAFVKQYLLKNVIYAILYSLRIIFIVYSFNIIINGLKKYNVTGKKVFDFIIKLYFVVCIIGIIQLIFFPKAYDWYQIFQNIGNYFPNPDFHIGRLLSTYFDPNYLSVCLLIPLSLSLSYWLNNNGKKYLFCFLFFVITILLTVSRSGLLGAMICILVLTLKNLFNNNNEKKVIINKKVLMIYFISIIGLIFLILLDSRIIDRIFNSMNDPSTFFRFESWTKTWKIIVNNMFIGIGYNAIGFYNNSGMGNLSTSFGVDSSLLLIFVTMGIVGLIYFAVKVTIRLFILNNQKNIISNSLIAIIVSSLILCNFNNLLFYTLWLVPISVLFNIYEREMEQGANNVIVDARMIKMSGIGTYIQNLVKNDCYDVALGNRDELKHYFNNENIIDYNYSIYGVKEQLKFPYFKIYKLNPSVLHVPHYNVPIFYSGRMIVTIHDLTHIILPKFLPSKFAYIYARLMIGIACFKAEKILTVSESTKNDIIKYYHVNAKKIKVIYNGVGSEFVRKDIKNIRYLYKKYNIPKDKKILLYVGNLKPHKNLENLLNAFSRMKNKEDCIIVLVGKAFENYNVLSDVAKKLNISKQIVRTGIVSQDELVDLYNLADLFIFPSLYEGFGLPILEALKCGTPVICSNTSSMPEVGGNMVAYFDPYNTDDMKKCIEKNVNLKKQLDYEKVLNWLNQFNWENASSEVKKVLKG